MAPRRVSDTWDWTATPAKLLGRYLRASASDIEEGRYPRPDGATIDTACRCYLRGPDGVSGLSPSGTWGEFNIVNRQCCRNCALRAADHADCGPWQAKENPAASSHAAGSSFHPLKVY